MNRGVRTGSRVAVLGGTGWVGRHVCAALALDGHRVLCVARNRAAHVAGHPFLPWDLAAMDSGALAAELHGRGVAAVVNATDGANTTDGWDLSEDELRRTNADAVRRLAAALAAVPRPPRLVHLGTIHEYGPVPAGTAVGETADPRPASAYARTKLQGSAAVLDAARTRGLDAVVLRLTNVCGPHPSPQSFPGKLLALARSAAAGEPAEVTVAAARRDFVDVHDVAAAVRQAVRAPVSGTAVNIGSGTAVEIGAFVAGFLTAAGLPPGAVAARAGEVPSLGGPWVQADIRLAERVLGWRPRTSLGESLRSMWEAR